MTLLDANTGAPALLEQFELVALRETDSAAKLACVAARAVGQAGSLAWPLAGLVTEDAVTHTSRAVAPPVQVALVVDPQNLEARIGLGRRGNGHGIGIGRFGLNAIQRAHERPADNASQHSGRPDSCHKHDWSHARSVAC